MYRLTIAYRTALYNPRSMIPKNIFLIFTLIFFSLSACEKSEFTNINGLSGIWFMENDWDEGLVYHLEYNFKTDSTIEIMGSIINLETKKIIGYSNKQNGSFTLKGDSIIITSLVQKYALDGGYKEKIEELDYSHSYARSAMKMGLNAQMNELTLTSPPCLDYADCLGSQVLKKLR